MHSDSGFSMASFDETLIILFQNHPCLYDKKQKLYKDATLKDNVWKKIANSLKCDVAKCQARMKCLRERYAKEKKAQELGSRSGAGASSEKIPWFLVEALAFLDDHIKPRKMYSNFDIPEASIFLDTHCSNGESSGSAIVEYDGVFDVNDVISLDGTDDTAFTSRTNTSGVNKRLKSTPELISAKWRKATESAEATSVAEHMRAVAEATSMFKDAMLQKKQTADAGFAQYVCENLSSLPEDLKDNTALEIHKVIVAAKRKHREMQFQ